MPVSRSARRHAQAEATATATAHVTKAIAAGTPPQEREPSIVWAWLRWSISNLWELYAMVGMFAAMSRWPVIAPWAGFTAAIITATTCDFGPHTAKERGNGTWKHHDIRRWRSLAMCLIVAASLLSTGYVVRPTFGWATAGIAVAVVCSVLAGRDPLSRWIAPNSHATRTVNRMNATVDALAREAHTLPPEYATAVQAHMALRSFTALASGDDVPERLADITQGRDDYDQLTG